MRSRAVAMQVAYGLREDVHAGCPSIKEVRLILSLNASRPSKGRTRMIARYDVSVAFFHADLDPSEKITVIPPLGLHPRGWAGS